MYGPHHTPMLQQFIIAGTKERFEGHTPTQHPQHYTRLLGGSLPINLMHQNEATAATITIVTTAVAITVASTISITATAVVADC